MGEVYAVRVHTADGSIVDLLLFATRAQADKYVLDMAVLPLGFDSIEVVPRIIVGMGLADLN